MERDFEKELKENELYQFLRRNDGCRLYRLSQNDGNEMMTTFTSNSSSVYFHNGNGTYDRIDMSSEDCRKYNSKSVLNRISRCNRVEKCFDGKWVPVWTQADGFIDTDYENFLYIHERYYTFKEIEHIIDEVKSLKKTVASLIVY